MDPAFHDFKCVVIVALDPLGSFAFVANQSGSISAYTIDATTGALTSVAGSPFPGKARGVPPRGQGGAPQAETKNQPAEVAGVIK